MLIGLTTDRTDVTARLREVFSEVLSDEEGNLNYLLSLASEPRRFHEVRWAGCSAVRSLDPDRVLIGLSRHLGGHTRPAPGEIRLDALAVVRDGTGWLLPAVLRPTLSRYARRLRDEGFVLTDEPWPTVDLKSGEVVVGSNHLFEERLRELAELAPHTVTVDPGAADGRYPLAGVVFGGGAESEEMPAGHATTHVLTSQSMAPAPWDTLVSAVYDLLVSIRRPVILERTPARFVESLRRATDQPGGT